MTALTLLTGRKTLGRYGLHRPSAWPSEGPPQAGCRCLGLVTAALALLAFSRAAARRKPMALTVASLLEPLTVVVPSSRLLGQRLDAVPWLGGGLLLASIWALGRRAAAQARPASPDGRDPRDDAQVRHPHVAAAPPRPPTT